MLRTRFRKQPRCLWYRCACLQIVVVLLFLNSPFVSCGQSIEDVREAPALDPNLSDRRLQRVFDSALALLGRDDLVNALPLLQSILDHPRDSMYREDEQDEDRTVSLKGKVLETIERFTPAQREQYRILYEASAQEILERAQSASEVFALEEVVRRYYFTETGAKAARELAKLYFDRGQTLSAALTFQRLLREKRISVDEREDVILQTAVALRIAGLNDESLEMLERLGEETLDFEVRGEKFVLEADREHVLQWLDRVASLDNSPFAVEGLADWKLFRGNHERNAASEGVAPLREAEWEFRTIPLSESDDPRQLELVESELRSLARRFEETNYLQIPALNPLLVENIAIFRSLGNLKAIDVQNGEMLWETFSYDSDFISLVDKIRSTASHPEDHVTELQKYLMQRTWRDLTSGTLSCNGDLVFAVEEQGLLEEGRSLQDSREQHYNKLMAYELRSGKAVWELGSPTHDRPGFRFLGPPLVQGNTLYCIVSINEVVHLVALKCAKSPDGRNVVRWMWEQPLPMPVASELEKQMPLWKLSGLSPSYANGVLICPIAHGTVVGFDLARGIFSWKFRYQNHLSRSKQTSDKLNLIQDHYGITPEDENRWLDHVPVITNGRVLLTPCDSSQLFCIRLSDGSLQWSLPRQDDLYIACEHQRQVILVGRHQVHARDLETGRELWSIDTALPSGRGFLSGERYYLPLSNATIAVIDVSNGELVTLIPSQYDRIPGNLIAANGIVVSQTRDRIYRYLTGSELDQQLQAPESRSVQVLRGELALLKGQPEEGIAELLKAYQAEPDARVHQLLVYSMLDGLRDDFSTFQRHIPFLKQLTHGTRAAYTLQELLAKGLASSGERVAAFREFLKLVPQPEFMLDQRQTSIRSDVWIRGQLEFLYSSASSFEQQEMNALLAAQLEPLFERDESEAMVRAARMFYRFPQMETVMRNAIQSLNEYTESLQLEQLLILAQRSPVESLRGEALARHYRLLMKLQRIEQAALLRTELLENYADERCLEGQTGRELAEWGLENRKLREFLEARDEKWSGRPISVIPSSESPPLQTYHQVPIEGDSGVFSGWGFSLSADRPPRLLGIDAWGSKRIDIPLSFVKQSPSSVISDRHLYLNGHLAVLVFSDRFYVLDLLQTADNVLLHGPHNLKEPLVGLQIKVSPHNLLGERTFGPNGHPQITARDLFNEPLGKIALVGPERIVFQRDRSLVAIDWQDGELLWSRKIGQFGQTLIGNDRLIGCLPRGGKSVSLYHSVDGTPVGNISLAGVPQQTQTFGAFLIVQEWIPNESNSEGRWVLSAYHPEQQQAMWMVSATDDMLWQIVEPGLLGTLDRSSQEFRLISMKSGEVLMSDVIQTSSLPENIDTTVEDNLPLIQAFYLDRLRDDDLLLCIQERRVTEGGPRVNVSDEFHMPQVNGEVIRLRFDGRIVWRQRVEHQAYDPSQPAESPVIAFLSRHHPSVRRFVTTPHESLIDLLSRETGESLYHQKESRHLSRFLTIVLPDRQLVKLFGNRTSYVILFGEQNAQESSNEQSP